MHVRVVSGAPRLLDRVDFGDHGRIGLVESLGLSGLEMALDRVSGHLWLRVLAVGLEADVARPIRRIDARRLAVTVIAL